MFDDTTKRILSLPTSTMLEVTVAPSITAYFEDNLTKLPVDRSGLLNSEASDLKQHIADTLLPCLREELASDLAETNPRGR